jgi:DNA polymerase III sliding clamp (beta) subunit (PCNA family)
VVVNERYLAEIVSLIHVDSIVLQFSENKPVIVRGVGDSSFLGLIMPMRL